MQVSPTRKEVQQQLSVYAQSDTMQGVSLFVIDIVTYLLAIALVLFAPLWYLKLIGGILAGIKIANLSTLAHDAAHNSLTKSRTLNKYLTIIGFAPGLFNYALWLHDHHFLHHRKTNEEHPDSYVPLSKQEYDALSPWRRFKYRMYRAPSVWLFGLYYIVERWWQVKLFPRAHMPKHVQREAWRYFSVLAIYFSAYLLLLVMAPYYSQTRVVEALVYGFIVPFYVFQTLYSFTVFVQHNHYQVPWFKGIRPRDGDGQQAYITVHLAFPKWISWAVHHVYDHAAHHVYPSIPSYTLPAAQSKLNELLGANAVTTKFSFHWLYGMMSRCKLYDFEHHRWTDFNGIPTTRSTLASQNHGLRNVDYDRQKERRHRLLQTA